MIMDLFLTLNLFICNLEEILWHCFDIHVSVDQQQCHWMKRLKRNCCIFLMFGWMIIVGCAGSQDMDFSVKITMLYPHLLGEPSTTIGWWALPSGGKCLN